jgi:hypothetical protein
MRYGRRTQDSYSGAHFAAGQQSLNAAQALAFVRQRRDYVHPELNFTDLDRARRQQAFLASAAYQLKSAGTLTNPVRLHDLIEVAAKDIVIDDGLDLLSFAQQAPALTGGGLSFTTLPVKAFDTVGGQSVNLVDEDEIKKVVHGLLEPDDDTNHDNPPATLPAATLDVTNATGRDGLAATLTKALTARGLTAGSASTDHTLKTRTTLYYSPQTKAAADAIAALLPNVAPQPNPDLQPGHLRLVLGTDFTTPSKLTTYPQRRRRRGQHRGYADQDTQPDRHDRDMHRDRFGRDVVVGVGGRVARGQRHQQSRHREQQQPGQGPPPQHRATAHRQQPGQDRGHQPGTGLFLGGDQPGRTGHRGYRCQR